MIAAIRPAMLTIPDNLLIVPFPPVTVVALVTWRLARAYRRWLDFGERMRQEAEDHMATGEYRRA